MTLYYLNSAGSDTSPYDTAAKGAADLDTLIAVPLAAGDIIYMDKGHIDPNQTVSKVWDSSTGVLPIPIIRVDTGASDVYAPANVTAGTKNFTSSTPNDDMEFAGFSLFGVYIDINGDIRSALDGSGTRLEDCKIEEQGLSRAIEAVNNNGRSPIFVKNCAIESTGTGSLLFSAPRMARSYFSSNSITGAIVPSGLFDLAGVGSDTIKIEYCDLSGLTDASIILINTSTSGLSACDVNIIGCKYPSPATSFSLTDDVFGNEFQTVTSWNSDNGSDLYPLTRESFRGVVDTDIVTYHDSGWVDADQNTNLSHEMIPDGTANRVSTAAPLQSFDIVQWQDSAGTFTVTVECLENYTAALQDDEAWLEVFYLDGTDVLVSLDTTQTRAGDTKTNLTAGTGLANWTGEPASSRSVKLVSGSLTVGKAGLIVARIYMGKFESGKQFFYDPVMTIA